MNLTSNIGKIGASLWIFWVFITYLIFQPDVTKALTSIPYVGAILGLTVFVVAMHFFLKMRNFIFQWRGLYWLPILLVFSSIIIPSFYEVANRAAGSYGLKLFYFSIFSTILLAALLFIFSSAWSLGQWLIDKISLNDYLGENQDYTALAFGISILGAIGTLLGFVGLFNQISVAIICILPIILNWKNWLSLIKKVVWTPQKVQLKSGWHWPLFAIFSTAITISWIGAIKAFPTGNDGASLYVNIAHKLAQIGSLPSGDQAYAWSVFMAFGEALSSNVTVTILLSHVMGILSMAVLYQISRNWLSRLHAILVITIVYLSPYFAFHSIIDEKVDLALLFFILVLIDICIKKPVIAAMSEANSGKINYKILIFIGWLCGFAFSIKYASLFLVIPLFGLLAYQNIRQSYGLYLIFLGIFYKLGSSIIGAGGTGPIEEWVASILIVAIGLVVLLTNQSKHRSLPRLLISYSIFILGFGVAFAPWVIKNISENGSVSVESILEGKKESPTLITNPFLIGYEARSNINTSPLWGEEEARAMFISDQSEIEEATPDAPDAPETSSINAQYEELQRYMGFESGIWRYLSLPTDLTFSINVVGNRYVVIGFIFLCLIPLCFFQRKNVRWNITLAILGFILLVLSLYSINDFNESTRAADEILLIKDINSRHPDGFRETFSMLGELFINPLYKMGQVLSPVYNLGSAIGQGYSLVALICLLTALFFFSRSNFLDWPSDIKRLAFISMAGGITWWAFGLGVVWYGLFIFALAPVLLVFFFLQTNNKTSLMGQPFYRLLFKVVFGGHVAIMFLLYFSNPRVNGPLVELFPWPDLNYATEAGHSQKDVISEYNQYLPELIRTLNQDPKAKIYLINTQTGYHINNYDRRVFEDDILANYGKETRKYGKSLDYYKALGLNGYEYVLFDLNTPSMDKTPEQSLSKRCQKFIGGILRTPYAELVLTDNLIYDENAPLVTLPNGQRTKARPGMIGQMLKKGSFALFKLKVLEE